MCGNNTTGFLVPQAIIYYYLPRFEVSGPAKLYILLLLNHKSYQHQNTNKNQKIHNRGNVMAKRVKNESEKRAKPSDQSALCLSQCCPTYTQTNCSRCSTTSAPQASSNSKPCDRSKLELGRRQSKCPTGSKNSITKQKFEIKTQTQSEQETNVHNPATKTAASRTLHFLVRSCLGTSRADRPSVSKAKQKRNAVSLG